MPGLDLRADDELQAVGDVGVAADVGEDGFEEGVEHFCAEGEEGGGGLVLGGWRDWGGVVVGLRGGGGGWRGGHTGGEGADIVEVELEGVRRRVGGRGGGGIVGEDEAMAFELGWEGHCVVVCVVVMIVLELSKCPSVEKRVYVVVIVGRD